MQEKVHEIKNKRKYSLGQKYPRYSTIFIPIITFIID